MTVVAVETSEELKQSWLRQVTCVFYSLSYGVNIDYQNSVLCDVLNIIFDRAVLYGNGVFSPMVYFQVENGTPVS